MGWEKLSEQYILEDKQHTRQGYDATRMTILRPTRAPSFIIDNQQQQYIFVKTYIDVCNYIYILTNLAKTSRTRSLHRPGSTNSASVNGISTSSIICKMTLFLRIGKQLVVDRSVIIFLYSLLVCCSIGLRCCCCCCCLGRAEDVIWSEGGVWWCFGKQKRQLPLPWTGT